MTSPRLAIVVHRLGPYHVARLKAAASRMRLVCVEACALDKTYGWDKVGATEGFETTTLFARGDSADYGFRDLSARVKATLTQLQPDALAIPGWDDRVGLHALKWAVASSIPVVLMSESNETDAPRQWLKERIKQRVVRLCGTGLVGGSCAVNYLARLGLAKARIFQGYDAVDNDYFASSAEEAREHCSKIGNTHGLPEKFFLASGRFVEKKNLSRLLQAYARYRALCASPLRLERGEGRGEVSSPSSPQPWNLVLLGDGPLRSSLLALRSSLGLEHCVRMPGFKQYGELPSYYGLASAFVHASTVEQWGLVVNEAMASGLPVLVSNRCGCAPDLVQEGVNGFTFDPLDIEQLALLLLRVSGFSPVSLSAFGAASRQIIGRWSPAFFADSLWKATQAALALPSRKPSLLDRILVWGLLRFR